MRLNMTSQQASKLLSLIAPRRWTVILLIISKKALEKDDVAPKVRLAVGQFGNYFILSPSRNRITITEKNNNSNNSNE